MILPEDLRASIEARVGRVHGSREVGGGCISSACRLEVDGNPIFLKFEQKAPTGFFEIEAAGLEELRASVSGARVPAVAGWGESEDGWSWLALEWLEPAPRQASFGAQLGRAVAALHSTSPKENTWGWKRDGYIGRLRQPNGPARTWAEFWLERRIRPQLEAARRSAALGSDADWDRLLTLIPHLLAEAELEGPSPLHGDLWGGNAMAVDSGPALIDPAFYRGHREVDLAMTRLFGGFDRSFYETYTAELPLRVGHEGRRGVYQLFYLLVHVNLFGVSYAAQTVQTLRGVLAREA